MSLRLLPALLAFFISVVVSACTTLPPASEASTVSFAVLGDAEPKPKAEFPNVEAAVQDVNGLAKQQKVDLVLGVGDIAHKGTLLQYDNVTPVLQQLSLPFYPIMGNEEHGSTVDRFLQFANRWNNGKVEITSPRYVLEQENVAIVMASPDFGRDFNDSGIAWMLNQIRALSPKPVLLVVHGAQTGIYPERADKGIKHPGFADVVAQSNLAAVISGDLHMDMDRVVHSKQIGGVHYLHIPALERTKIPDSSRHNPMFRVFNVHVDNTVTVDTYQVGLPEPLQRHAYQFDLRR